MSERERWQRTAITQWARAAGMPPQLIHLLQFKIDHAVFDAGESFMFADLSLGGGEEEEEEEGVRGGTAGLNTQRGVGNDDDEEETAPRVRWVEGRADPQHRDGRSAVTPAHSPALSQEAAAAVVADGAEGDGGEEELRASDGSDAAADEDEDAGAAGRPPGPSNDHRARAGAQPGHVSPHTVVDHPGGSAAPAPKYALVATTNIGAYSNVWLVDHCFTFALGEDVHAAVRADPELRERLTGMLGVSAPASEVGVPRAAAGTSLPGPGVAPVALGLEDVARVAAGGGGAGVYGLSATVPLDEGAVVDRVCEAMWPYMGFYHARRRVPRGYGGGRDGEPRPHPHAHLRPRTEAGFASGVSIDEMGSPSAEAEVENSRVTCWAFLPDEVGTRVSLTTRVAEANVCLEVVPVYLPEKGGVFSALWPVADMTAGTAASRHVTHRWAAPAETEVADVLYNREDRTRLGAVLRRCVADWLAHRTHEASQFQVTPARVMAGVVPHTLSAPSTEAMAGAMQALGPVLFFTDSGSLARLVTRFSALAPCLTQAAVPRQARLVWRTQHGPRDLREWRSLAAAEFVFWLPGEHTLLGPTALLRLVRRRCGHLPWYPVLYDAAEELSAFIGDYLVRENDLATERAAAARVAGAAADAYDPHAEHKRRLRHRDGTNYWVVQRITGEGATPRGSPALPHVAAADAAAVDLASSREPSRMGVDGGVETGGEGVGSTAVAALFPSTDGDGAGGGSDADAAVGADPAGAGVVAVSANLEELLRVTEAYPCVVRKLYPSPALALCGVSLGPSGAARPEWYRFPATGDAAPVFQFLVCVRYRCRGDTDAQTSESTPGGVDFTAHVHHVLPVKWMRSDAWSVREVGAGAVDLCTCGPVEPTRPAGAPAETSSNVGSAAAPLPPQQPQDPQQPPLPSLVDYYGALLASRAETAALASVGGAAGLVEAAQHPQDGLLSQCYSLLRELFAAIAGEYAETWEPAVQALHRDGACPAQRTYGAVYGVDVSLALSPLRAARPYAGSPHVTASVQPVLVGLTRAPELARVAVAHPGVYGDILSAVLLGSASNATRVL